MWYTAVGSLRHLSEKDRAFLGRLGRALSLSGFKVRTGGRGIVDDVLRMSSKELGGTSEVITPFPLYRDYDAFKDAEVFSYSDFEPANKELSKKIMHEVRAVEKITSEMHLNLVNSSPAILFGPNLNAPSRFLITWQNDVFSPDVANDDIPSKESALFSTQESPIFKLAIKKRIPIFNIANPLHRKRIDNFIDSVKTQTAS